MKPNTAVPELDGLGLYNSTTLVAPPNILPVSDDQAEDKQSNENDDLINHTITSGTSIAQKIFLRLAFS